MTSLSTCPCRWSRSLDADELIKRSVVMDAARLNRRSSDAFDPIVSGVVTTPFVLAPARAARPQWRHPATAWPGSCESLNESRSALLSRPTRAPSCDVDGVCIAVVVSRGGWKCRWHYDAAGPAG